MAPSHAPKTPRRAVLCILLSTMAPRTRSGDVKCDVNGDAGMASELAMLRSAFSHNMTVLALTMAQRDAALLEKALAMHARDEALQRPPAPHPSDEAVRRDLAAVTRDMQTYQRERDEVKLQLAMTRRDLVAANTALATEARNEREKARRELAAARDEATEARRERDQALGELAAARAQAAEAANVLRQRDAARRGLRNAVRDCNATQHKLDEALATLEDIRKIVSSPQPTSTARRQQATTTRAALAAMQAAETLVAVRKRPRLR